VERSVEVPCDADRVVIRLRLVRPAQSIRFAVECQARTT
jgi:hypothetical protein